MKNVADVYPLSSMQHLMLLHTLSAPASDILFNQFSYEIKGQLDQEAFAAAWQQVVDRHSILRTAFLWDKLKKPLQVVRRRVKLPFTSKDWRLLDQGAQQVRLDAFLQADREQGFDPAQAPLMRATLLRLADRRYRLVWSSHHLLLDRWCIGLVLDEVAAIYEAQRNGRSPHLSPARPFRDYIAWVQQQEETQAQAFWQRALQGVEHPTLLAADLQLEGSPQYQEQDLVLSATATADLRRVAQQNQLTMNGLLQGAWAILLSRHSGSEEVVFGTTASGRPADLAGVETMLGSFINNVPVRATVKPNARLIPWLQSLQAQQLERQPYEYVSPLQIQAWSAIPEHLSLFDTLLVFQAPVRVLERWQQSTGLTVHLLEGKLRTQFPLTLAAEERASQLLVRFVYDGRRFTTETVETVADNVERLLTAIATNPDHQLATLQDRVKKAEAAGNPGPLPEKAIGAIDHNGSGGSNGRMSTPPRLPVNEIETQLVHLWQGLLQKRPIHVDDDFFTLGGTSLQAMRLFGHIEEVFGVNLPLSALIKNTTVEQLATVIGAERGANGVVTAQQWSSLVEIQRRGSRPPFFCVHGLTGDVLWFRQLGALMAPDQPFYGLEAVGLNGNKRPFTTIEAMAAHYIEEIRSLQPEGPYFFGGASFGGTVALEMAHQLQAAGQKVGLLVSFDHAPVMAGETTGWSHWLRGMPHILSNFPYWLTSFIQLNRGQIGARVKRKMRVVGKQLERHLGRNHSAPDQVDSEDLLDYATELPPHRRRLIEVNYEAIRAYTASPYGGDVLLLRARSQPLLNMRDPVDGWHNLATGRLTVSVVPGSHEGMFHFPHVETVARELRSMLDDQQST